MKTTKLPELGDTWEVAEAYRNGTAFSTGNTRYQADPNEVVVIKYHYYDGWARRSMRAATAEEVEQYWTTHPTPRWWQFWRPKPPECYLPPARVLGTTS